MRLVDAGEPDPVLGEDRPVIQAGEENARIDPQRSLDAYLAYQKIQRRSVA